MLEIVYVLGSTRSGTSALRNAIALTRYKGHGEGHLAPLLAEMVSIVRSQKVSGQGALVSGNGLFNMDERHLLRHLFGGYENYLAEDIGSNSVVDKTPTPAPIKMASDLNQLHSSPKFIHCSRRHLDNVMSKVKKFPQEDFGILCSEWRDCNLAWLESREELEGNFIEFDFFELVERPDEISERIGSYLNLSLEDSSKMCDYLRSQRPQSAQVNRDLTRHIKWSEVDWTNQQRDQFLAICGPLGRKLGYGLEKYFD